MFVKDDPISETTRKRNKVLAIALFGVVLLAVAFSFYYFQKFGFSSESSKWH